MCLMLLYLLFLMTMKHDALDGCSPVTHSVLGWVWAFLLGLEACCVQPPMNKCFQMSVVVVLLLCNNLHTQLLVTICVDHGTLFMGMKDSVCCLLISGLLFWCWHFLVHFLLFCMLCMLDCCSALSHSFFKWITTYTGIF
jgi:hypothetical protein